MRALALAAAALAAACAGEVVTLEAVPVRPDETRDFFACDRVEWSVLSVRVQVIAWQGSESSEPLATECFAVEDPGAIHDEWSMLEQFSGRGYVARGLPVDEETRVQLLGFDGPGCSGPERATVCAVNLEAIGESTHAEGDPVPFSFLCRCTLEGCGDPSVPRFGTIWSANRQWFDRCLYLESLDDFGG